VDEALARAVQMHDEGAAIIDIGGESTRPGARRIDAREQISRVVPVIQAVAREADVLISIDTTLADVARAAIDAGAGIVNDVSAGREDERMIALIAESKVGYILMHRLHPPDSDSYSDRYADPPVYGDVVAEVAEFLRRRAADVTAGGVEHQRIVIDPGLGFGKTVGQNVELVARFAEILALGYPVLSAASRKSFIGRLTDVNEPSQRLAGTLAVSVAMLSAGARLFRVHDVAAHRQALDMAAALGAAAR